MTSKLAKFYGIKKRQCPTFVFVKRYEPLNKFSKLHAKTNGQFDSWVWDQFAVQLKIINNHDADVNLYWIHSMRVRKCKQVFFS